MSKQGLKDSPYKPCPICGHRIKFVELPHDKANDALVCTNQACAWFITINKGDE